MSVKVEDKKQIKEFTFFSSFFLDSKTSHSVGSWKVLLSGMIGGL